MSYVNGIYTNPGWVNDQSPPLDQDNMNDISNALHDLTVKPEPEATGGISNQNLLLNWDFRNPINQRGETSYTKREYTVDMWYKFLTDGSVFIEDGIGLQLTTASKTTCGIIQGIESLSMDDFMNNQFTFSMVWTNDTATNPVFYFYTNTKSAGVNNVNWSVNDKIVVRIYSSTYVDNKIGVLIRINGTEQDSFRIQAVKLEIGSNQTLVGNPPAYIENSITPQYLDVINQSTELLKCQRYLYVLNEPFTTPGVPYDSQAWTNINNGTTVSYFIIPTPVTMRSVPSIKVLDRSGNIGWNGSTITSLWRINAPIIVDLCKNGVLLKPTNVLESDDTYCISSRDTVQASVILSAEL